MSSLNDGLLLSGETEKLSDGGLDNFIDYSASINGGSGAVTLDTSDAGTDPATGSYAEAAISGDTQTITITPASGNPLLPGSYSDTLTVTVSPEV